VSAITPNDTRAVYIARIVETWIALKASFGSTQLHTPQLHLGELAKTLDVTEGDLADWLKDSPDLKAALDAEGFGRR
jgi:hypothetical protein